MSYKKILVAVDGSDVSYLALTEAINLAHCMQAKLCMTLVVNEFPGCEHFPHALDLINFQKHLKEEATCILNKMNEHAKKLGIEPELKLIEINMVSKKISQAIIDAAKDWQAELIIVGTHGRHGLNRWLLGSITEELIHITPLPILLIRSDS